MRNEPSWEEPVADYRALYSLAANGKARVQTTPSVSALDNSIFKLQMLTFNVVVVFNILGSLHVLSHQLHGDHPQRVHLPHTHSGSVEASFETQSVSENTTKPIFLKK